MKRQGISARLGADSGYFVVLALGRVRLAIPERDIRTLELVDALQSCEFDASAGAIVLEGNLWPVFGLNDDLDPVPVLPQGYRVSALMEYAGRRFGIACTEVWDVRADQMRLADVPPCMLDGDSPIMRLAVSRDQVFGVSSAQSLADYLQHVGCRLANASVDHREQRENSATGA